MHAVLLVLFIMFGLLVLVLFILYVDVREGKDCSASKPVAAPRKFIPVRREVNGAYVVVCDPYDPWSVVGDVGWGGSAAHSPSGRQEPSRGETRLTRQQP